MLIQIIDKEGNVKVRRQHNVITVSKGLGDTVHKITHVTGVSKLVEIYTSITGNDCGCEERRVILNKLVPYKES